MHIAVLINLKDNAPHYAGMPADRWDDLDSPRTPEMLCETLRQLGHQAEYFEANLQPPFNLLERLRSYQPDLCFNLAESHFGNGREAQIPALLELLQIPYTGSRVLGLALMLDKALSKRLLRDHGLPTAEFQLFTRADEPLSPAFLTPEGMLRYPLFVKPNAEGTSMGVDETSVVRDVPSLRAQVAKLLQRYQPILVERYIAGREVLVGMVGNPATGLHFLPITELDFAAYGAAHPGYYTNAMKNNAAIEQYHYHCPAHLSVGQVEKLHQLAAATFTALHCHDFARVDFRLDSHNHDEPYIIEINPLPGLNPGYSDLCLQALAGGWPYEQLIAGILTAARQRWGINS